MKIAVEKFGKVTVLKPQGQLTHPVGDALLRDTVRGEIENGRAFFVLEMSGVPFVDSAGMGEMVACLKRAKENNGDVKLSGVTQRVSDTLVLLGLAEILDTFPTAEEAIASFV